MEGGPGGGGPRSHRRHTHVDDPWTTAVADLVWRPFRRYGTTLGPLWGTASSSPERCGRARPRLGPSEDGIAPEKGRWESVIELKVFIYESDSLRGNEGDGDQLGFRWLVGWGFLGDGVGRGGCCCFFVL